MRWKLLLISSLVATIVGAGAPIAIILGWSGSTNRLNTPDLFILTTLVIPLLAITFASIFVYRHTARRRSLQAMMTVLLAGSLTLAALTLSSIIFSKPAPATQPAPRRNVS